MVRLLLHSKKVMGLNPTSGRGLSARSLHVSSPLALFVCVGFLRVFRLPHKAQRHAVRGVRLTGDSILPISIRKLCYCCIDCIDVLFFLIVIHF